MSLVSLFALLKCRIRSRIDKLKMYLRIRPFIRSYRASPQIEGYASVFGFEKADIVRNAQLHPGML